MKKPAAVVSVMFVAALCLVTSPSASAAMPLVATTRTGRPPRTRERVAHHHSPTTSSSLASCPAPTPGSVYRIDAGTTGLHLIRPGVLDFALLSPDATQFADFAFTSEGVGTTAIFNVDGIRVPALADLGSRHTLERAAGRHMVRGRDQDRRGGWRPGGTIPPEWHLLPALIRRQRSDPADRRRESIRLSGAVLAGRVKNSCSSDPTRGTSRATARHRICSWSARTARA